MYHEHAPFGYIAPADQRNSHVCIVPARALRHKNMPPKSGSSDDTDDDGTSTGTTVPGASTSGSTSGSATTDATLVPMEYLKDEDEEVFVPRTHTLAVQNSNGDVLDDILTKTESRLTALEQGIAPSIKIADNLLTDAASIALSARQGKLLNEAFSAILGNEEGDVRSNGSKLVLQDNSVTEAHISPQSITSDAIVDGSVTADKLAPGSVLTDSVGEQSITKAKLSEDLQDTIANIEDITEWRTQTDERLDTLEAQMQQHIATDTLLKEQNQFLLREHQKMKHLDVTASIYNATTDATVQGSISVDDIRMSGLQVNYKWRYWDEIDAKDYTPTTFKIEAKIHSALLNDAGDPLLDADGNQKYEDSILVLSTDKGLNNLDQVLRVRALNAGSTVKIVSTVNYCWLDWTHTYNINITA